MNPQGLSRYLGLDEPVRLPNNVLVVRIVEDMTAPHSPGVLKCIT